MKVRELLRVKRQYLIYMVCFLFGIMLLLSGCEDKAAREVDELIASIGKVSIDSGPAIEAARSAYDALEEKSKENVKNFDILKDAEANYVIYAVKIAIKDAKKAFKNFDFEKGYQLLKKYKNKMTDEELMECMEIYGQWYAFKTAEDALISRLKDPYSYSRMDESCSIHETEGVFSNKYFEMHSSHYATIEIDYRATNSFGGYMTETFKDNYFFTINLDNLTIDDVLSTLQMSKKAVKAGYSSGI